MQKPSSESSDSLSQLKIKNPGERFDLSIVRVAVGKLTNHLTLKMASAQAVEMSVANNSPYTFDVTASISRSYITLLSAGFRICWIKAKLISLPQL